MSYFLASVCYENIKRDCEEKLTREHKNMSAVRHIGKEARIPCVAVTLSVMACLGIQRPTQFQTIFSRRFLHPKTQQGFKSVMLPSSEQPFEGTCVSLWSAMASSARGHGSRYRNG